MQTPDPFLVREVLAALPQLRGLTWLGLAGGRTNRVWRVGGSLVKRYLPDEASPLFPNEPEAEQKALSRLGPLGLAPRLQASGAGWIAYAYLPGQTWQTGTAAVARCLGQVHALAPEGFRAKPSGSAALLAEGRAIGRACRAPLPEPPPDPGVTPVTIPRLIHGDPVPGNLIAHVGRVTPIDWQCPAAGDPTEDLAMFLSPAMQWLYRGAILDAAEEHRFLAAYPDPAVVQRYLRLSPLYRWRMTAHCLWKSERGDADYGTALSLELGQSSSPIQTPIATSTPPVSIQ